MAKTPTPHQKSGSKPPTDAERAALTAERREAQAREGELAMAEYLAHIKAEREKTARLRALRLAKEEADRKTAERVREKQATVAALKAAAAAKAAAARPSNKPGTKPAAKPVAKPKTKPAVKTKKAARKNRR
jgi:hypothetical protein